MENITIVTMVLPKTDMKATKKQVVWDLAISHCGINLKISLNDNK